MQINISDCNVTNTSFTKKHNDNCRLVYILLSWYKIFKFIICSRISLEWSLTTVKVAQMYETSLEPCGISQIYLQVYLFPNYKPRRK